MVAAPPSPFAAGGVILVDDVRAARQLLAQGAALLALGLAGVGALVWAAERYWVAWALALGLGLLGAGLLVTTLRRLRFRDQPYLVLEPGGVRCPGLREPFVPWSALAGATVVGAGRAASTNLFFRPGAVLPTLDGSRSNLRLGRRRRVLSIAGPVPRDMAPEELANLLRTAITGAADG